jgi:hypothetical protein
MCDGALPSGWPTDEPNGPNRARGGRRLEEATVWYEQQRLGLGTKFLEAIDGTLERVAHWPHAAPRQFGIQVVRS